MFATKALRSAAAHAERVPSIKFIGKRSIPCTSSSLPLPPLHDHNSNKASTSHPEPLLVAPRNDTEWTG